MKRIFLILGILSLCLFGKTEIVAATTFTAVAAGGNWTTAATWDVGTGYPVAGDTVIINATMTGTVTINAASACAVLNLTANGGTLAFGTYTLTVSGLATLQGAMTATTGILSVAGGVTLAGTPTGTFPTLSLTASQTLTGATFTWGGALKFLSGTPTIVLPASNNWINTGLVTVSSATVLNATTGSPNQESLTCNGGFTIGAGCSGTATIIMGGGTLSSTGYSLVSNLTFNGNSTVSGTIYYYTGTITYVSGTVTTTNSTLNLNNGNCTLKTRLVPDTGGITWNNITIDYAATITLSSNLTCTGTLLFVASTVTFSGAYNISCGTFRAYVTSAVKTLTFVAGQTLTATAGLKLEGTGNVTYTIKAPSTTTTYLNYTGTSANCEVYKIIFTYVDASGSAQGIDNWYGGTLTNTTNITNRTSADIGGGGTGFFTMGN